MRTAGQVNIVKDVPHYGGRLRSPGGVAKEIRQIKLRPPLQDASTRKRKLSVIDLRSYTVVKELPASGPYVRMIVFDE